jgi:HEAT repeat protein
MEEEIEKLIEQLKDEDKIVRWKHFRVHQEIHHPFNRKRLIWHIKRSLSK